MIVFIKIKEALLLPFSSAKDHGSNAPPCIDVARGGQRGHGPPKFLENLIILCFERRFSKQNSVICLKSNILASPNFWAGYATAAMPYVSVFLPATAMPKLPTYDVMYLSKNIKSCKNC